MENFQKILFDKSIYEINLLPQRSSFSAGRETVLSGTWHGAFREEFDPSLMELLTAPLDGVPQVEVPLPLELQGYGQIRYANVQYPFDGYNEGEIGGEILLPNACMLYLKDVDLPEKQENKRYILNFKGSESAFFLYVNGEFAGYSENLFLDSEFDVTAFLHEGSNRLGVLSFRYCASTWLLDQDFFRFSGLTRDVILREEDTLGVFDIDIHSQVDSAARLSTTTFTLTGEKALRELTVTDPNGNVVWNFRTEGKVIVTSFRDILLWSAEIPNLYTLTVKTFRGDDVAETAVLPFGFREVAIRDGILTLNGKRLIFNGVNRHEWNLERGRSVTRADMDFDTSFMKSHNINAVRTSHYPNHSDFYGFCDQKGLYMIDEACLESHGTQYGIGVPSDPLPGDKDKWVPICVNKLLRMYERDKNHPAILLWSLGNESGSGTVFFKMREALLDRDPDALIHYEGCMHNREHWPLSDVYSTMYTGAQGISDFISDGHDDKPYILCEFAHAMGNSLGDLDAYRALLPKHPTFQGGFVWDFIDQALMVNGQLLYGGDAGDRPNDRDFCGNGIIFADRSIAHRASKAHALKYTYQPIAFTIEGDRIRVKNNYLFRDTSHLCFRWEALHDGEIVSAETLPLNAAPGCEASFPIAPAATDQELLIRVFALRDNEPVAWEEAVLSPAAPAPAPALPGPKVVEGSFNIGVTAGNVTYFFAKTGCSFMAAGLTGIKVGNEEFLCAEPRPTIFRPTTSNDIGCGFFFSSSLALAFSRNIRCDTELTRFASENGRFTITYRYILDPQTREGASITYSVDGAGALHVEALLDPLTRVPSLAQFGLHFQLPKAMDHFRYFGRGRFDNYPDRKRGCLSGIYESRCADEFVPYINPQECGNHEDVRWVEIRGQTAALRFTGPFSFKYLPNSDFEIDNALHVDELPQGRRNHLTISGFTRGVGGDDSWWAPVHEPFTLPGDRGYRFQFTVSSVNLD